MEGKPRGERSLCWDPIQWKSLETGAGEAVAGEMEQGGGIERSFWNSEDTVSSWGAWVRGVSGRYRTLGGSIKKLFPGFCLSTVKDRDLESIHLGQELL